MPRENVHRLQFETGLFFLLFGAENRPPLPGGSKGHRHQYPAEAPFVVPDEVDGRPQGSTTLFQTKQCEPSRMRLYFVCF